MPARWPLVTNCLLPDSTQPVSLGRSGLGIRGFVTLNNLFDSRYIASSFLNPDVVNDQPVAFEPGLPRNFVVSLSLGWLH